MTKIKKYKNAIERFLSGDSGQRFFNFAYSIGAAVVILGALFKLLHLPYGNLLLIIGMGTEVLMFLLTAFDRPPRQYRWEEIFPEFDNSDADVDSTDDTRARLQERLQQHEQPVVEQMAVPQPQPVVIARTAAETAEAGVPSVNVGSLGEATENYAAQISALAEQMADLRRSTEELNKVTSVLLQSYNAITENSDRITASSQGYVDEMTSLNRNVAGLNTIYEIQLKSVSSQLDSIDRVNNGIKDIRDMYERSAETSRQYCEETERMALYMKQLNSIYAQMIQAMTQNLPGGAPAGNGQ